MKLLLDSHALLWFWEGSAELSTIARRAIENPENEKFVSMATAWEIAIKVGLGKLQLDARFESLFPDMVEANGFQVLQTDFRHFHELLKLPFLHRDPFDRLLIAQSRVEGMTVATRDPQFLQYGIGVLW